jgi:hypothetical protein
MATLVMHPKYKLRYFDKEGWLEAWKIEAKRILRAHWDRWYKPAETEVVTPPKVVSKFIFTLVGNRY